MLTGSDIVLLDSISLFVAGNHHQIIPVLVWYHRFGPLVGKRKAPKVDDLCVENGALGCGRCLK